MKNLLHERQLIEAQMNVYKASMLLNSALSSLSRIASEIAGESLVADLCGDDEIEFRRINVNNDLVDDDYTAIRMEDILTNLKR